MNEQMSPAAGNEDKKYIHERNSGNGAGMSSDILWQTGLYIQEFFETGEVAENGLYNYPSALKIVRSAQAICMDDDISKQEWLVINLAAWFLQTGYKIDSANPLEHSAELAENYLTGKVEDELIAAIKECILATRFPQQPATFAARVICDAANFQLSEKKYPGYLKVLRKETRAAGQKEYSETDWLKKQVDMLDGHIYYTEAAKKMFEKGKKKNKKRLKKMLKQMQNETGETEVLANRTGEKLPTDVILEDKVKLERGVESLFRITSRRHIELSNLAHNKASLLISINALIISVVLSVLSTKLQDNRQLILPTVLLILTNVSTMVLAFFSTRPVILGGKKNTAASKTNETNILFFGHFLKLSLDEFKMAIRKTIMDKEKIYDSLSRDIYYQGLVLARKYKFITLSYYVFIIGLSLSVLVFILTFVFYNP